MSYTIEAWLLDWDTITSRYPTPPTDLDDVIDFIHTTGVFADSFGHSSSAGDLFRGWVTDTATAINTPELIGILARPIGNIDTTTDDYPTIGGIRTTEAAAWLPQLEQLPDNEDEDLLHWQLTLTRILRYATQRHTDITTIYL